MSTPRRQNPVTCFIRHTELKESGCIEWTGAMYRNGYGKTAVRSESNWRNQRMVGAHVRAWELFVGPVPQGLYVLHDCDNRRCVNVCHLKVGTQLRNMRDMVERGRCNPPCLKGSKSGKAKLTEQQVLDIRSRLEQTNESIANEFGVSDSLINAIRKRQIWKHI